VLVVVVVVLVVVVVVVAVAVVVVVVRKGNRGCGAPPGMHAETERFHRDRKEERNKETKKKKAGTRWWENIYKLRLQNIRTYMMDSFRMQKL
jgi:flagellar basal body-associated protein FliL